MIFERVQSEGRSAIAFVGVAKNAGKTTALARTVEEIARRNSTAGVVSIGIDGESSDAIFGIDKPSLYLPDDFQLVAGARALERASARFEFLARLGFETLLGRAYLVRVVDAGSVVAGGLRHRSDLVEARRAILDEKGWGCGRLLVDGAYGRTVAADGRVVDAVVLATGAAVSETIEGVIERTRMYVELMQLDAPDRPGSELLDVAIREGRLLVEGSEDRLSFRAESTIRGLRRHRDAWPDDVDWVALPGALTEAVASELLDRRDAAGTVVVASPASIQMEPDSWRALEASDWCVAVAHPVELEALAVNPTDPRGDDLEVSHLIARLRREWPELAIVDARACKFENVG